MLGVFSNENTSHQISIVLFNENTSHLISIVAFHAQKGCDLCSCIKDTIQLPPKNFDDMA